MSVIAVPLEGFEVPPDPITAVRPRDLILLQGPPEEIALTSHRANALLDDLIYMHYLVQPNRSSFHPISLPSDSPVVREIASRLFKLLRDGKQYQLAGLKDVPRAFLKDMGYFYKPSVGAATTSQPYVPATDDEARHYIAERIVHLFANPPPPSPVIDPNLNISVAEVDQAVGVFHDRTSKENTASSLTASAAGDSTAVVEGVVQEAVAGSTMATPTPAAAIAAGNSAGQDQAAKDGHGSLIHPSPRPLDVVFLPQDYIVDETLPYEHQSGNKHLLYLASQYVAVETNHPTKRVPAALKLITSMVDIASGSEITSKFPRYIVQHIDHDPHPTTWHEMPTIDLAEYATVFVYEVFLEKQIHTIAISPATNMLSTGNVNADSIIRPPSEEPVEAPILHDVLFGRGGMTNAHAGNRRFRDIIALHRPDYIRATKMDKPNVARRIVRAIRQGDPPGRFMKKGDDGKWYDVGDRCAAEKTSQGLRERSNAEKRQRCALREALRIRREDLSEGKEPESKIQKTMPELAPNIIPGYPHALNPVNYAGAIPLSLSMKEQSDKVKAKEHPENEIEDLDIIQESLPPNAVDKDGNILVTDYDILCGRGGLTNHHKGNKRFRDIVALHRPDYVRAPKIQKPSVARVIVRAIRNGDPPGRFLKKNDETGKWCDIGDKRAAEKTSQALREKALDEKDVPQATVAVGGLLSPVILAGTITKDLAVSTAAAAAEAAVHAAAAASAKAVANGNVEAKTEGANKDSTSQVAEI